MSMRDLAGLALLGGAFALVACSNISGLGSSSNTSPSTNTGGPVSISTDHAQYSAKDNIQVNAVLPGWIDTELTRNAREQVPGLHERVLARTPAGRWGEARDLAGIAVFLASAASDFVTGTAIPVDGGYSSLG